MYVLKVEQHQSPGSLLPIPKESMWATYAHNMWTTHTHSMWATQTHSMWATHAHSMWATHARIVQALLPRAGRRKAQGRAGAQSGVQIRQARICNKA